VRKILAATLVVAVAAGLWLYFDMAPEGKPAPAEKATPQTQKNLRREDISWATEEAGQKPDEEGAAPLVDLSVSIEGNPYLVGRFEGSCWPDGAKDLSGGEISGATCWWAGFGQEIRAVQRGGAIEILRREIGETENGEAPFVGEYSRVLRVELRR
jgi:hypothetical protein